MRRHRVQEPGWLWLWLWLKTRPTPVPYLTTSSVAPAPCSARARPCLDCASMFGGVNLCSSSASPTRWPARTPPAPMVGRPRAGKYGMVFSATSGFGVGWVWAPAPAGVRPVLATRGLRVAALCLFLFLLAVPSSPCTPFPPPPFAPALPSLSRFRCLCTVSACDVPELRQRSRDQSPRLAWPPSPWGVTHMA